MKQTAFLIAAVSTACPPIAADNHLDIGDIGPVAMQDSGSINLTFVARLDDCFGCRIQGGYAALRSVQRKADSAYAPRMTALLVTRELNDTLALSAILKRQRIIARIKTMTPGEAIRILDPDRLPAIYLLKDGRVVRKWEAYKGTAVHIERNEIFEAFAELRNEPAKY